MNQFRKQIFLCLLAAVTALTSLAREAVTITFSAETDMSETALTAATIATNITEGAANIGAIDYIERVFGAAEDHGLKFGSKSGGGTLAFSLSDKAIMFVKAIRIGTMPYGTDDPMMGLWVNDDEDYYIIEGTEGISEIAFSEPRAVEFIELQSLERCYLNSITFIPTDGAVEATPVALPTFSIARNRVTIQSEGATAISYMVTYPDRDDILAEPITVEGTAAEVRITADCSIEARAYAPGIDPDNYFTPTLAGNTITREFKVEEISIERAAGWVRLSYGEDVVVGDTYLIAAPDFDMVMLRTMENSKKGYDSHKASFSSDHNNIYGVDQANAVTWTESAAGLHGFRFDDGTYISASGDNISNSTFISGSGNTSVEITPTGYAVIKFGSTSNRQLLYHEGYDFRLNASINDDNPAFGMPALYRHVEAGTETHFEASAVVAAPTFLDTEGHSIATIVKGESLTIAAQPGREIMICTDGSDNFTTYDSDNVELDTDLYEPATTITAKAYDPYTEAYSATATITVIESAGITDITADDFDSPTQLYDLMGRSIVNPTPGIYLERKGNRTTKRLVR